MAPGELREHVESDADNPVETVPYPRDQGRVVAEPTKRYRVIRFVGGYGLIAIGLIQVAYAVLPLLASDMATTDQLVAGIQLCTSLILFVAAGLILRQPR